MTPIISIIIPVYNVEKYILECLQSVVSQTKTDGVECILVDDCGNDRSIQLIEDFIDSYSGNISFSVLHHSRNRGASGARNTGMKAAKGQYIFFLDADDVITPFCLSELWSLVEKYPGVDFVQGSCVYDKIPVYDVNVLGFPDYSNDRDWICSVMLHVDWFPITPWNKLVRRDLLMDNQCFFKEGIILEDNLWSFYLSKIVGTIAFCRTNTYFYRENPTGVMNSNSNNKVAEKALSEIIIDSSSHITNDRCIKEQILFVSYFVGQLFSDKRVAINPLYYIVAESRKKMDLSSKNTFKGIYFRTIYHLSLLLLIGVQKI